LIVPDIVDSATRSRMMSGIRGLNTRPELRVRRYLHARGIRYRLHKKGLPGRPDIVLGRYRTVVFVHGCFWHRHEGCRFATRPDTNADFWRVKFGQNVERDQRKERELRDLGWRVEIVWECEGADRFDRLVEDLMSTSAGLG
jgi:DNA mismatch endonuclease (patch repair protein)